RSRPRAASRTAIRSAFDNATYSTDSSGLSNSAVGCEPAAVFDLGSSSGIQRLTLPALRSSSATRDAFHSEHQARLPSRLTMTAYGKAAGTIAPVLRSNRCKTRPLSPSSNSALSARLLATSRRSPCPDEKAASPAGKGTAVPFGALDEILAARLPCASGGGAMERNRSCAMRPSANEYTATPLPVFPFFAPLGSLTDAMEAYKRFPSGLNASPRK